MSLKMNKVAKNVSVDAGIILISDEDFYKKWNGDITDRNDLFVKYNLENGQYKVTWTIYESWNGKVGGKGILNVNTGSVIVSDPCYHFKNQKDWNNLLNNTDCLNNTPDGCILLDSMGGDGSYNVHINFERI